MAMWRKKWDVEPLNERRSLDSRLLRLCQPVSFFIFTDLKNLVLMANHWTARRFPSPSFLNTKEKDSIPLCPFSLTLPGTPTKTSLGHQCLKKHSYSVASSPPVIRQGPPLPRWPLSCASRALNSRLRGPAEISLIPPIPLGANASLISGGEWN